MNLKTIRAAFERVQTLSDELKQMSGSETPRIHISPNQDPSLDQLVTDTDLLKVVYKLFNDGHHARAVEEACKFMNKLVQKKSGVSADGADLMRTVFSPKNPLLRINSGQSASESNEQQGYMDILAGAMTGFRNPRAHDHEWEDTEERALQLLHIINHLVLRIKQAEKR